MTADSRQLSSTICQSTKDAKHHMLICGSVGTGMSTYVLNLIAQDIRQKTKVILFDPWGDLVDTASKNSGENTKLIRIGSEQSKGFLNIFTATDHAEFASITDAVISLFVQMYDPQQTGIIGPRFDSAIRNVVTALLYAKEPSFLNMARLLIDTQYVNSLLPRLPEGPVLRYWTDLIAHTSDIQKSEILDYVVSKLNPFIQEGIVNNLFDAGSADKEFTSIIRSSACTLVDLSPIHKQNKMRDIVLSALTSKLFAYMQTDDVAKTVYIDEIQLYKNSQIIDCFEYGKKTNTSFVVVTRDIENMNPYLRSKILRFGTLVAFRTATEDANILAKHFYHPTINPDILATEKQYVFSLKYLSDGEINSSINNMLKQSDI